MKLSVPWTYVFCVEKFNNVTLAESIAKNLEGIYWTFENEYRHQRNQKPRNSYARMVWENPQPMKLITESMPLLVLYLMTQKRFPHKVPIANVSIFSSTSVSRALEYELKKIESSRQWKNFPRVFERKVAKIQNSKSTYMLPEGRWD